MFESSDEICTECGYDFHCGWASRGATVDIL